MDILDQTETNLVALRRTVYLTIQSRYYCCWKDFIAKNTMRPTVLVKTIIYIKFVLIFSVWIFKNVLIK